MAQEQDDNFTELCNHVHGDMLTENPTVAQSAFGLHRFVQDNLVRGGCGKGDVGVESEMGVWRARCGCGE